MQELTPDIKPQVKYYLNDAAPATSAAPSDFSRLKADDMVPISANVSAVESRMKKSSLIVTFYSRPISRTG